MQDSQIVELYEEFESCRIVAEKIGVSDETVRRALIRQGVRRTHRHPKPETGLMPCRRKYCWPAIASLRALTAMSPGEIAGFTGASVPTVSAACSARGLCTRRKTNAESVNRREVECEYLAGATTYELGERYGVYPSTIGKWMRARGHHRGKPGHGWQQTIACELCGREFVAGTPSRMYCDECSSEAARRYAKKRNRQRYALKRGAAEAEGIHWRDLMERDHGICQICGMPVDVNDTRWGTSGPLFPSQDHIVPLSKGGQDTMENSQLAHVICNSVKNDRGMTPEVVRHAKEQAAAYQQPRVHRDRVDDRR